MARAGRLLARRGWAAPAEDEPWRQVLSTWFQGRDLLLMPTLAYPAPPLGRWRGRGWLRTLLSMSRWPLTGQWNLAGVAACSVPAGLSREGLPLAVQLVAPPGHERLLLQVAARIESRRAFPALSIEG